MIVFIFRYDFIRNIISFSSDKVLLSGVAYTIILVYISCLILTYLIGESLLAQSYLLWEALFLFIILVLNFLVAFNEEYIYRNEITFRVRKVLSKYKLLICIFELLKCNFIKIYVCFRHIKWFNRTSSMEGESLSTFMCPIFSMCHLTMDIQRWLVKPKIWSDFSLTHYCCYGLYSFVLCVLKLLSTSL